MIRIFLLLVFAVIVAYVASQNSMAVDLRLAQYAVTGVPLYLVIIAAVGGGFLVGFIFNLITKFSLHRAIGHKTKQLEESRNHILELTRKIHQLELAQHSAAGGEDEKSL